MKLFPPLLKTLDMSQECRWLDIRTFWVLSLCPTLPASTQAATPVLAMQTPIKTSAEVPTEIDGAVGHDDTTEVTSYDGWSTRESRNHVIYCVTSHYVQAICSCLCKYEM